MHRRQFLTAISAVAVGPVTGCLGAEQADDTAPSNNDESFGRSQWGYDAGNSNYAAGITGPIDEPGYQGAYAEAGGIPLIAEETFYVPIHSISDDAIRAVSFGGDLQWEEPAPVGTGSSHPALYEDVVVNAGRDPDLFWAVSVTDGEERWQTGISAPPRRREMTVAGDRAYMATSAGIGCVDLAAQEEAWNVDLERELDLNGGQWLPPVATLDHVFALNGIQDPERDYEADPRQLYALDPESGEIDWAADLELGEPGFSFGPPIIGDQYVFVIANVNENPDGDADHGEWLRVVAVDPSTREEAWTETLEGAYSPDTLPASANGHLYVNHQSVEADESGLLSAIETADGSVAWTVEREYSVSHLTATDEALYAVDDSLRALDPANGEERWSIDLLDLPDGPDPADANVHLPSPPVVHDDRVFVYLNQFGLVEFG